MYQSDYILRQIEMLGAFLRRMLDAMRTALLGEALLRRADAFAANGDPEDAASQRAKAGALIEAAIREGGPEIAELIAQLRG